MRTLFRVRLLCRTLRVWWRKLSSWDGEHPSLVSVVLEEESGNVGAGDTALVTAVIVGWGCLWAVIVISRQGWIVIFGVIAGWGWLVVAVDKGFFGSLWWRR